MALEALNENPTEEFKSKKVLQIPASHSFRLLMFQPHLNNLIKFTEPDHRGLILYKRWQSDGIMT